MSGKTYIEISKISRVKKDLVLYMAAKMKWYEKRMEYLDDIQKNITKKVTETRVESLNFISSLINMHHKYYGDAINQYLRTGDRDIIDGLDLKQLTQYFKSIEMLEKILNPSNINRSGGSNTTVNINAAGGVVEQVSYLLFQAALLQNLCLQPTPRRRCVKPRKQTRTNHRTILTRGKAMERLPLNLKQ